MGERVFQPLVLETKAQLLSALKSGQLECSKYNTLTEDEKLFVEMLVFGDFTAEQAMRAIKPTIKDARAAANRMIANPAIAETLEELSTQKDKKYMTELGSARDMALHKLKYIMNTTRDEAVAAACAKTILDKAEKMILESGKKKLDDEVTDIKFAIKVDTNFVVNPRQEAESKVPDGVIEVEIEPDEQEDATQKALPPPSVGENGLPFTISYEGIDNYHK